MKPRANPGNRTRQPKGCANRIAKPARLGRTSQNHLTMIILSKTGATTVAQHDCEPLAAHAQSETAVCKRHVLCANFSKTRALFLLLSHRPRQRYRAGGSPTGGVFVACATLVRLCDCVLACRVVSRGCAFLCMRSWPSRPGHGHVVAAPVAAGAHVSVVYGCVAVAWLRHADECSCLQWF